MFGEGRHPHIERIFDTKLAPFLSQSATHFWRSRLWYFKQGLYYQGGMVSHSCRLQISVASFLDGFVLSKFSSLSPCQLFNCMQTMGFAKQLALYSS